MDTQELKEITKTIPNQPGVYQFENGKGTSIYIGKAAALKQRLKSYLKTEDHRIRQMVAAAATISYIATDSEIEALILESQLIKQKQPQFNIMLRDDKQYFYVQFSDDEFPKIWLTHQPQGGNAIGPFTEGFPLKATLRFLRSIFPYCTCTQTHHNFCLNYHIGKCLGICCLKHPETKLAPQELKRQKEQYLKNIHAIKDILNGKRTTLIKELQKEMDQLARDGKLEEAIALRTKRDRLITVFEHARIIKTSELLKEYEPVLTGIIKNRRPIIRIEGYDVSNIQGQHATGSLVTFIHGQPDKNYYRKFNIRTVKGANDTAMLQEILTRRFDHDEWPYPDLIIIDGGKGQVNYARVVLKERDIAIPIVGLVKNEKHVGRALIVPGRKEPLDLARLTARDQQLILAIDAEAHRFAIAHYRTRHRQTMKKGVEFHA